MRDGLPLRSFVKSECLYSRSFAISRNGVLDEGGGGLFKHTSVGVGYCDLFVSLARACIQGGPQWVSVEIMTCRLCRHEKKYILDLL